MTDILDGSAPVPTAAAAMAAAVAEPASTVPAAPAPTATAGPALAPVRAGRCFGDGDPLYESYHDTEWGRPVRGEAALFERLVLEGFQSGLAWITILRKRDSFRAAFADFDARTVAAYDDFDVARLMADAAIVRNRQKIEATISNARALDALHDAGGSLEQIIWSHAPDRAAHERAAMWSQVPSTTPESAALAKALKAVGFRFVGPTTAYAAMQACGVVDDHLASCPAVAPAS